jgi:hypothetical protein
MSSFSDQGLGWWVGLMENSKEDDVGGVRCPVLRRRPHQAGGIPNDDTREKAAGSAPVAASVRRGIDRRSDNWSSRPVVFPGAARPGTATKSLVFPIWDLSKDFFRSAENRVEKVGADSVVQRAGNPCFQPEHYDLSTTYSGFGGKIPR